MQLFYLATSHATLEALNIIARIRSLLLIDSCQKGKGSGSFFCHVSKWNSFCAGNTTVYGMSTLFFVEDSCEGTRIMERNPNIVSLYGRWFRLESSCQLYATKSEWDIDLRESVESVMSHQCLLSLYIFQSFGTTRQCRWLKDGYSYFNDDNDATIAQFNTGTANGRSRKKLFITIFFICIAWILDF